MGLDNWVDCFKCKSHRVIPHLKDLEYLSLELDGFNDEVPAEDFMSLNHATSKF